MPVIERVEKGLFNMLKQSSEKLAKRRQEDIKDQCDDHKSSEWPSFILYIYLYVFFFFF